MNILVLQEEIEIEEIETEVTIVLMIVIVVIPQDTMMEEVVVEVVAEVKEVLGIGEEWLQEEMTIEEVQLQKELDLSAKESEVITSGISMLKDSKMSALMRLR